LGDAAARPPNEMCFPRDEMDAFPDAVGGLHGARAFPFGETVLALNAVAHHPGVVVHYWNDVVLLLCAMVRL